MNPKPILVIFVLYLFYYIISTYNWFQIARLRVLSSLKDISDQKKHKSVDSEDRLLYARRVVKDLTFEYNQKLKNFPTNFLGKLFGFKMLTQKLDDKD